MAKKVMARAVNWSAVQNHSESGPMNDNPSVLMSFTTAPSVLLPRWARRYASAGSVDKGRGVSDAAPGCPVS